jgi:hypothetical protein
MDAWTEKATIKHRLLLMESAMVTTQSNKTQAYPAPELMTYMEKQAELFEKAKPQLLEQFLDRYVWFEDEQVRDSDVNHETLVLRIYGEGEPRPLFIRKVVITEPQLMVRSPLRLT